MPAIPEGFTTLTPSLTLNGAAEAIEIYKKAFAALEIARMEFPGTGRIMHACLRIGSSHIFLNDTDDKMNPVPSVSAFYVYLPNVDEAFAAARAAGLAEMFPVQDMFWGDRTGCVRDKFGITWTLASHVRDVSPEEMEEARRQWGKAA